MPIDKTWLTRPNRSSPEYKKGVSDFIELCKTQLNSNGDVRCACKVCHNTEIIPFNTMKHHMSVYGFCKSYKIWSYHGEGSNPPGSNPPGSIPPGSIPPIMGKVQILPVHTFSDDMRRR
ncbi:hypothetical protein LXL04_008172 [Taraxacum kok-saghyz]